MAFQFMQPGRTVFGENALGDCKEHIRKLGTKALIITGKVVTKSGIIKNLTDYLEEWGISYHVFNDITSEPTDDMIDAGVKAYEEEQCNFIIGIGGGSPLDSAKAVAAMSVLGGDISELAGKEIAGDFPPVVLIPTTAGTGSETTKFTIITDTKKDVKMLLKGDDLLPELAIIDPIYTYSMPKSVTAATGMDALTHAIEAYTSKKGNVLTDMYALSAIEKIFKYLPIAYMEGMNAKARSEMALAAFEAGVCINNASVTLVHGMSRPIGALFHVPHGISNAMLIKECMSFALDGCYERFADIARRIGVATAYADDRLAAGEFLQALEDLCRQLEIPTLQEYGIEKEKFVKVMDKMAADAIQSGSPANTMKEISKDDIIGIYTKLW